MRINIAQILEDTELVTSLGASGLSDVVKFCDTRWGSGNLTEAELGETQKLADCQRECLEEWWWLLCLAIGNTKGAFLDGVFVVHCVPAPSWREEFDTWGDIIDVPSQVVRYVVSRLGQNIEQTV